MFGVIDWIRKVHRNHIEDWIIDNYDAKEITKLFSIVITGPPTKVIELFTNNEWEFPSYIKDCKLYVDYPLSWSCKYNVKNKRWEGLMPGFIITKEYKKLLTNNKYSKYRLSYEPLDWGKIR